MSANLTPAQQAAQLVDSLGPEALAKAAAYTTGNHWLLLLNVVISLLVALVMRSCCPRSCAALPIRSAFGRSSPSAQRSC